MFFFFPLGGGGGLGSFIFFLIFIFLIGRVFRSLFSGRGSTFSGTSQFSQAGSYAPANRAFFEGTFSMLAKLASADGQVSESARSKINQFMIYDLRLDEQSYNYARSIFNRAIEDQSQTFETLADTFYNNFSGNTAILQLVIDMFYRLAMADGHISSREEEMLDYAARRFRIPDSIIDAIKRRYGVNAGTSSKAYAVLGLKENATEQEIKKAYRRLILEFHPDTVAQKGAGQEFKEYATRRFREIQEAYEAICKERGIK